MREWDPIGVRDAPEAQDESDRCVSDVYVMLMDQRASVLPVGAGRGRSCSVARGFCGAGIRLTPAPVHLAPSPTRRPGDRRIPRPALIGKRHVLGTYAPALSIGVQTRSADAMTLSVAAAITTIGVAPPARGTFRNAPVVVAASMQAVSAVGHKVVGMRLVNRRPVAGE